MGNKIIAVGPHYKSAIKERGKTDIHPLKLFLKPFSSIINENQEILIESFMEHVVAEAEIALLLKKDIKNVDIADIILDEVVEGVTLGLDVTLLDEDSFSFGKIYDTFTPLGNFNIINPYDIAFSVFLNNNIVQHTDSCDLGLSFEEIISYCSKYFTLKKGDMILTGTPKGTFRISRGDFIEIRSNLINDIKFKVR